MSESPTTEFINPQGMATPRGYSHVALVKSGHPVYIAGQVALDAAGQVVGPDDMRAQAEQVFANLAAALAAVGATFHDVVKLTYFLVDISQIAVVREVRDRYVNMARPPASTAVEVARLVRDEFLLEIEAVAVVSTLPQG